MFLKKKNLKKLHIDLMHAMTIQHYRNTAREPKPLVQTDSIAEKPVVVSFTTYAHRIHDVYLVLESISQQTLLPNRVVLWLAEEEFRGKTLPLSLTSHIENGLEIKFCRDLKSYKKIIPSLKEYPDNIIVTFDDDIVYPHDTIERLVNEHKAYPSAIIGNRAHKLRFFGSQVAAYKKWKKEVNGNSHHVFLTGSGAILYPPATLYKDVTNDELFMKLCPHADDVWLFVMARLNNTEIRKASGRHFHEYAQIPNYMGNSLNKINVDKGENDRQLKAVLGYYKLSL